MKTDEKLELIEFVEKELNSIKKRYYYNVYCDKLINKLLSFLERFK
jgi:hypothetical protein